MSETKVCKKCGDEKSVSNFSKAGVQRGKQYYHTTCKECTNTGRTRVDNLDPKTCNKCGICKPLSEYALEKRSSGMRYRGECKSCKYIRRLEYREENPEVVERDNARKRWRYKNVAGVAERRKETHRQSYERHGDKWKAKKRERYSNDPEYAENIRQYKRDLWASSQDFKEKSKEQTKKWIEENRDRYDAANKKYYEENKEKISEYGKKYREENADHCSKLRKSLYEKHQDKLVEEQKQYRKNRRAHLIDKLGGKCVKCGTVERLQFDHINPLEKSFTLASKITAPIEELYEELKKCQLLCNECHLEKTKQEWLSGILIDKRGY